VTPWQDSSTLPMLKLSLFESNTPPPRAHQLMRKFIIFLSLLSLASVASAQADNVLKMDTDPLLTSLDEDVSMQESAGRNPPVGSDAQIGTTGARMGKWLIGDKGHGHFVINDYSHNPMPQFLLRQDGEIFRKTRHNQGGPASFKFPSALQAKSIRLGAWTMGERHTGHFVISTGAGRAEPQFLLRNDAEMWFGPKRPGNVPYGTQTAPRSWAHTAPSANVLQMGDWLVGPKDDNHFVISYSRDHSKCAFLITSTGEAYFNRDSTEIAPLGWALRLGEISFPCVVTATRGRWSRIGSGTTPNWEYTLEQGHTESDSNTRDSSWASSVATSVTTELSVSHESSFGPPGANFASASTSISATHSTTTSNEESRSMGTSVSTAASRSQVATVTHRFPEPGAAYQFQVDVQDTCGTSVIGTVDVAFVRADAGAGVPCCMPNHFLNSGYTHGPCKAGATCFNCPAAVCAGTAPNTKPNTSCPSWCDPRSRYAHQSCSATACRYCAACQHGQN